MDSLKTKIDTAEPEMSLNLKAYITHNATGSLSDISGRCLSDVAVENWWSCPLSMDLRYLYLNWVFCFIVLHTFTPQVNSKVKNQIVPLEIKVFTHKTHDKTLLNYKFFNRLFDNYCVIVYSFLNTVASQLVSDQLLFLWMYLNVFVMKLRFGLNKHWTRHFGLSVKRSVD